MASPSLETLLTTLATSDVELIVVDGPGYSLLQTTLGPLDVLGAIEGGRDYDALLPSSVRIELAGHQIHVLGLEQTLRESKR